MTLDGATHVVSSSYSAMTEESRRAAAARKDCARIYK